MGTLKIHRGYLAIQSMGQVNSTSANPLNVAPYKTLDGATQTTLYGGVIGNYCLSGLVPVATADDETNYSIEDYAITAVGTTAYSATNVVINDTTNHKYGYLRTYSITVSNTGSEAITVKCIRFKKSVKVHYSLTADALIMSYYFIPETIEAGQSKTMSVVIEILNNT